MAEFARLQVIVRVFDDHTEILTPTASTPVVLYRGDEWRGSFGLNAYSAVSRQIPVDPKLPFTSKPDTPPEENNVLDGACPRCGSQLRDHALRANPKLRGTVDAVCEDGGTVSI